MKAFILYKCDLGGLEREVVIVSVDDYSKVMCQARVVLKGTFFLKTYEGNVEILLKSDFQ